MGTKCEIGDIQQRRQIPETKSLSRLRSPGTDLGKHTVPRLKRVNDIISFVPRLEYLAQGIMISIRLSRAISVSALTIDCVNFLKWPEIGCKIHGLQNRSEMWRVK